MERLICLPLSSSCHRSSTEGRPTFPLCTPAQSIVSCVRPGCGASRLWRRLATRRILRGSMEAHPDPGPFSKYAPTACVFKPKSAAGVEFGTAARLPLRSLTRPPPNRGGFCLGGKTWLSARPARKTAIRRARRSYRKLTVVIPQNVSRIHIGLENIAPNTRLPRVAIGCADGTLAIWAI